MMSRFLLHHGFLVFCLSLLLPVAGQEVSVQEKETSGIHAPYTGKFAIHDEQFTIWNGGTYSPLWLKGINLGVSVPGTQPGQLAASREDYQRWFALIREAGYNTIRIYTLHYPRFYEELHSFNSQNPGAPLLLLQGVWLEEQESATDLFQLTDQFELEMEEVVRAVHGDISIMERPGKADGDYNTDVSPWLVGYLMGREIFPAEVAITNEAHPGEGSFDGSYYHLEGGGTPIEAWLAARLEFLAGLEMEAYGEVRPLGFSSWPTLDPIIHPTESLILGSQEDDEQIDLANLRSDAASGGFFIGYHAYPYYPDFIVQDPDYQAVTDPYGPNSYFGYILDLKKHYTGIPLVIAEFGVPTSWGSAHLTYTGMDHGGISELEQGPMTIRMFENIQTSGCAGAIQFSLIDEWFKQTWITNPYSDRQYRHFWHNLTAPEQNFGILNYIPPPADFERWGDFQAKGVEQLALASDYTFFRIRLRMKSKDFQGDTLWLAIDTYEEGLGESLLPNGKSIGFEGDTSRAEFLLSIPMDGEVAQLSVIPSYDVFGVRDEVRIDTLVSVKVDKGNWNPVRWKTNYALNISQYIGELDISDSQDPYRFLNAVSIYHDSLDIRLPWTLLNYYAPTVRRAIHYVSHYDGSQVVIDQKDTLTDGIAITLVAGDEIYRSGRHSWSFWDYEGISNYPPFERKKPSFYYLKEELPRFNSRPVGIADSLEIRPGELLELNAESGLLANDFDIDGNELSVVLADGSSPRQGILHLHPNGGLIYEPDPGFKGADFFAYMVHDGYSYSDLVPVSINVGYPLGKNDLPEESIDLKLYPNPAGNKVLVEIAGFGSRALLEGLNLTGGLVLETTLNRSPMEISLEGLEPGMYFFRVSANDYQIVRTLVIQ